MLKPEIHKIKVHWKTQEYYTSLGYVSNNNYFYVKTEDIPLNSRVKVTRICDGCGRLDTASRASFYNSQRGKEKNICQKCYHSRGKSLAKKLFTVSKHSAPRTNKTFNLTLSDVNKMLKLFGEKCFYCGVSDGLGLDRLESFKGYEKGNIVPCCATCNRLKLTMSVSEFKDLTRNQYQTYINTKWLPPQRIFNANQITIKVIGRVYSKLRSRATERGKSFTISKEQYLWLRSVEKVCFYCSSSNVSGLDRFVNTKGYSFTNVVLCCTECNSGKNILSTEQFAENLLNRVKTMGDH